MIASIKKVLRPEHGLGMPMALVLMAVAVPLLTAGLALSSSLSKDSQVKTQIAKSQYATLAVGEYVRSQFPGPVCYGNTQTFDIGGESVEYTCTPIPMLCSFCGKITIVSTGETLRICTEKDFPFQAAFASNDELWPPDNSLVNISIQGVSAPPGDSISSLTVTEVWQDEAVDALVR